jgi:hypothetical protein
VLSFGGKVHRAAVQYNGTGEVSRLIR